MGGRSCECKLPSLLRLPGKRKAYNPSPAFRQEQPAFQELHWKNEHLLWPQVHYLCSPLRPREPRPGTATGRPWVALALGPRAPASGSETDGR